MACISVFRVYVLILFISLCVEIKTKTTESEETTDKIAEIKLQKVPEIKIQKVPEIKLQKVPEIKPQKFNDGAVLIFADEFKQTLERYLFGICPQTFRSRWAQMQLGLKGKAANSTALACDVDADHHELAGRLATLSLRVHTASRVDCSRFGAALANTLADLARTAANRAELNSANNEAIKKRKLSKSQKAKLQAKQRTALAVKKKAAAVAAAAAAKMAS